MNETSVMRENKDEEPQPISYIIPETDIKKVLQLLEEASECRVLYETNLLDMANECIRAMRCRINEVASILEAYPAPAFRRPSSPGLLEGEQDRALIAKAEVETF